MTYVACNECGARDAYADGTSVVLPFAPDDDACTIRLSEIVAKAREMAGTFGIPVPAFGSDREEAVFYAALHLSPVFGAGYRVILDCGQGAS